MSITSLRAEIIYWISDWVALDPEVDIGISVRHAHTEHVYAWCSWPSVKRPNIVCFRQVAVSGSVGV